MDAEYLRVHRLIARLPSRFDGEGISIDDWGWMESPDFLRSAHFGQANWRHSSSWRGTSPAFPGPAKRFSGDQLSIDIKSS
jgi:hypothetical protein